MDSENEKRRCMRHIVRNEVFCEIHQSPFFQPGRNDLVQFGPVLDISEKGMALMYAGRRIHPRRSAKLSLKLPDGGTNVSNVKFRTVSDRKVHDLPNSLSMRRLGVQFRKLSRDQQGDLRVFLRTQTI
jgi:hypothetical protein